MAVLQFAITIFHGVIVSCDAVCTLMLCLLLAITFSFVSMKYWLDKLLSSQRKLSNCNIATEQCISKEKNRWLTH